MKRKCLWCGERFETDHPSKSYCSRAHKDAAGNYFASRGKVIVPILLAWRAKRGRKGTSGAAAYQEMQQFMDRCIAELAGQGIPSASAFFEESRKDGSGASTWKDFDRKRPSRAKAVDDQVDGEEVKA